MYSACATLHQYQHDITGLALIAGAGNGTKQQAALSESGQAWLHLDKPPPTG